MHQDDFYQIFMRIVVAVYQHLSLRKFSSTKKLSIGLFSIAIKLEGNMLPGI